MHSLRVLVVDDEDTIRHIRRQILERNRCQIREAASAEEAIRRRDAEVPVILFSGWEIQENEERITWAGVHEVLVKPCSIEDLLEAVRRVTTA